MLNTVLDMFSYTFTATFPIANPIGMSTIFLSLTMAYTAAERREMAWRIALYSFCIYLVTLLAGSWIMSFFSISVPIVKISGGLIVSFVAWKMLNTKPKLSKEEQKASLTQDGDITFFPLTMPITAGAGSMAMVMAIGASIISTHGTPLHDFSQFLGATLGIAALSLVVLVCYFFADRIFAKLGKVGVDVVTQVSSFILLAVGVEVIWEGIKTLIIALPH